jgi:hypothetical protein
MIRANGAEVLWDEHKKAWVVRIQVGEEVMRRPCKNSSRDATDEDLVSLAIQTAHDDGYDLSTNTIAIKRA